MKCNIDIYLPFLFVNLIYKMMYRLIFVLFLIVNSSYIFAQNKLENKFFSYDKITGIGYEKGVTRRDPSDIIKVGDTYYVYYTKIYGRADGYWGTIWYATSKDNGFSWKEQGEVLSIGNRGTFDSHAVFTPNIICVKDKYYLYYTGVKPTLGRTDGVFENNSLNDFTAIGIAVADSPNGPFHRLSNEPILRVSTDNNAFDSYRVDDASLLYRDGKFWLYYKGRSIKDGKNGPLYTKMGVAIADSPEGPYIKYGKPILSQSHEVLIWPDTEGIYAFASFSSTIELAKDGLDFESKPLGIKKDKRPIAPGAYRPDLTNDRIKSSLSWGISMVLNGDECYLIRYSFK